MTDIPDELSKTPPDPRDEGAVAQAVKEGWITVEDVPTEEPVPEEAEPEPTEEEPSDGDEESSEE